MASQWVFGPFRLDLANACLWCGVQAVPLPPKAFAVLCYLVVHSHRLVSKDELLEAVWPETAVSDAVVRVAIGALRRALGDTAQASRYIATMPWRGYRFVASVVEHPATIPGPPGAPPLAMPEAPDPEAEMPRPPALLPPEAERRQLTVLFCDLVGSTALAGQVDPEDYREVMHAYHELCAEVVQHFEGYVAQYLGDGVLGYFGYPVAHEDDAQRAVRAGLGLLDGFPVLRTHPALPPGAPLAVRVGVHTGLAVVGAVGAGGHHEALALGETPNLASRLQHLAAPNTLLISAVTHQLVAGYFQCTALGAQTLPGLAQPMEVYRVLGASAARSRLEVAAFTGLTPLVGRTQEVGLLRACWTRVTEGLGQVVLLGGEAGIGKSRLVQALKAHVTREGHQWLECQGSPYYQHTALYPLTDLVARRLLPEAPVAQQVQHLEAFVRQHGLSPEAMVPLLAPLLSLPLPATSTPVQVSPEQQRQHTLHALLELLLRLAAAQPLLLVMEDLHWVDPTTLELLSLLVDQGPTTRILALCTYRLDFRPPWLGRAHCTQVTLPRLPRQEAMAMTGQVARGKALPPEVVEQIVAKTDGVPLFVEELTKMVLESGLLQEREHRYERTGPLPPLAIPTTLHDSLMARLDRLAAVKALAQLAATLGHEFSYALLRTVAPWEEGIVQRGLRQLVEAEFLYQRGSPPQATYTFKHVLIQDVAYQSLVRRTRQHYHQCIAQALETQFPAIVEIHPELVAQHYTAAGSSAQAVVYWQRAGQHAREHSANLEAVQHLTKGLALLVTLCETPARVQQELEFQLALGAALTATKGAAHAEVEQTYARARALCHQLGDSPHLFATLWGLCRFYRSQGALRTSLELGEQLQRLAKRVADPTHSLEAHDALGTILFNLGDYAAAWTHVEQGLALADPTTQRAQALQQGEASGLRCLGVAAQVLWCLGYPAQAVQRSQEALALAQTLAHPYSLAAARHWAISLHYRRREVPAVQTQAEALLGLATAQGFPVWVGHGTCWCGWGLAIQGEGTIGRAQLCQGMAAVLATGQAMFRPLHLVLLAETAGHVGQIEDGLGLLTEALTAFEATGQGDMLAEAYRLQGALLLQQAVPDVAQAEASFQQALSIARRQQAKSWELRAAMSLARLWQQQGKHAEARELLAPIYGWFTEGFDTADLQEAKALLEELGG